MSRDKTEKCNRIKCITCENYNREADFCKERCIENCTKQVNTDFSKCTDYLVNGKLVMF